jgi:hypothetical protein
MASCGAYKINLEFLIELLASKTNLVSEGKCSMLNLMGTSAFIFGIISQNLMN